MILLNRIFSMPILISAVLMNNYAYSESHTKTVEQQIRLIEQTLSNEAGKYTLIMSNTKNTKVTRYELEMFTAQRDILTKVLKPKSDADTTFLLKNKNAWIYYPSIQKSVRIASKQRLLGGDFSLHELSSLNLSEDYYCAVDEHLQLNDFFQRLPPKTQFTANPTSQITCREKDNKSPPYPKVTTYLSADGRPLGQSFASTSGLTIAVIAYTHYGFLDLRERPTHLIMSTGPNLNSYSEIIYSTYERNVDVGPTVFSVTNLRDYSESF